MTTDNRTNEPTDEQVEAAAKAYPRWIVDHDGPETPWEQESEALKNEYRAMMRAALEAAARAAQEAAPQITGSTSDGYHTFDELYEYRMLYNAHAAHGWLAAGIPVVKSWRHSDGEECFGGGWFIVTTTLPSGQVSNHYKAEHWGLFKVPEVELPPEYDGHSPHDAARRLRIEAEYAAPVLPSSGVDEDALAEVILAAEYAHRDAELRGNPDIGTLAHYQARAVAEWLKEQGR